MDDRVGRQVPQAFCQANPLDRVVAEQQRMLQVETLGIRAVQALIEAGPGQVIGGAGIAQFQHSFGVDQGAYVVIVGEVQLTQVSRQALQHLHRIRRQ